jgi:hypothetical protein
VIPGAPLVRGAANVDGTALERRGQEEEGMIIALYIIAAVIMAIGSLYFRLAKQGFS